MSETNDVTQVLRDVAISLKDKGFFEDPNWSNVLIRVFKDVQETHEKSIIDDLDNTHEISNSFAVDEASKFNKKSKKPVDESIFDMFDDSNASFEIPETQADPPREDQEDDMDDELNSEAFVAIPDEEMPTSDPTQSQDLLRGGVFLFDSQVNVTRESDVDKTTSSKAKDVELKNNCKFEDFDDNDAIDLEMSKLEWNDHDTGKEEDDLRSASVTPDLDFDILSSTKVAGNDNVKSASVTPDLDFDLLTARNAAANNALPQFSKSDFKSSDEDISSDMDRKEVENDSPTISKLKVDRPEAVASTEVETSDETKANGYEEQADTTQVFTKPTKITKNPVSMEVEIEATQLFIKPTSSRTEPKKINSSSGNKVNEGELLNQSFTNPASSSSSIEKMKIDNEDEIKNAVDDLDETQLFVKSNNRNGEIGHEEDEINDGATHKAKVRKPILRIVSSDEDDSDNNLVKTDSNAENINRIISSLDKEEPDVKTDEEPQKPCGPSPEGEEDEYNAATQIFKVKKSSHHNQLLRPSDAEDDDEVAENDERMEKTNGMDAARANENDIATQKFVVQKHKSRKRNHLISSSDEENDGDGNDNKNDLATEKFEVQKHKPHKRNYLISSSDEENGSENLLTPMRVESPLPTKSFVKKNKKSAETTVKIEKLEDDTSPSKTLESQKYDFLKDLEGADWSQLCDEANAKQSNVTYINAFDQCKELRIRVQNKLSTTSTVVKNEVDLKNVNGNEEIQINTSNLGNVRKSARNRKKGGHSESSATSDAEIKTSKPKKSRNTIPTPEILPSSSKTSSIKTEPGDVNGDIEMQATQAFVKGSSSTNKEQIKPPRVSTRRQAKPASSTVTTKTTTTKEPIRRLREGYNQSATYSPVTSSRAASVLSDENDNNNSKPIKGDQSTNDASSRPTRKRKAASEVFPVDESVEEPVDEAYSSFNRSFDTSDSVSRTSRNNNFRVMFTMIDPEPYKSLLKQLNVSIVSADDNYNALITDRVYRTTKFMCALASGKPIVSTNWLDALKKSKSIPDPLKFLLNDKEGEEKYKFCLAKTIREVGKSGGLFRNHSILVTPNTSPGPDVFKDVITSSGGKYLKTSLVARKDDIVLCISDKKDEKMWSQLKKKYPNLNLTINVEGFMQAIFQYNLDMKKYVIKN